MLYDIEVWYRGDKLFQTQVLGYDSAHAFFDEYPETLGYEVSVEVNVFAYIRKHTSFQLVTSDPE